MKTLKIANSNIIVPKGASGVYPTPDEMPLAHGIFVAVARRKGGKSVAISNLVRMMGYDRIWLLSPTASSNKAILDPLGIQTEDIYEDMDDKDIINKVIAAMDKERDQYELYIEQMKKYKEFLKILNDKNTLIPDTMLMQFYQNGMFVPPVSKYSNGKPKFAIIVDDAQNSKVFSGKTLSNLCIKHRHISQLKEGNALGTSVFIMAQNYKCVSGGLPKPVRSNCCGWLLFKNFNEKEKAFVAEELAIDDIGKEEFVSMWDEVCDSQPHTFLFIDMEKKAHHQSSFRRNFSEFIVRPPPTKKEIQN